MVSAPKVSVLIPTYNYAHILDETIASVLAQTYTDFELIIVDNCSNDNTEQVVSKYLADKRVSYYRNERNIGLSGNWNKCLELAKGDYLKFLCADDKFHPQLLEKYVPVMDENPNVALVSCYKELFGAVSYAKIIIPPFTLLQKGKEIVYQTLKHNDNFLGDPTRPMIRRSNLHAGPFGKLEYVTDWDMWVRHLLLGDCYIIPEVLAYGRKHAGQQQLRCKKLAINHIENYYLYKAVQTGSYGVRFTEHQKEIDVMVKYRAVKAAFAMYKLIPKIHKKQYRNSFKQLFKIAAKENTLFSRSLLPLIANRNSKPYKLGNTNDNAFVINHKILHDHSR